jgi:hypothetical protein
MMLAKLPPEAVVGKGVELMNEWAERLGHRSPVGKQLTSIVVPADGRIPATTRYHSHIAQPRQYLTREIWSHPGRRLAWGGGYVEPTDGSNSAYPKAGRNEPCPCGSGSKFKRCHGRPSDPKRTMIIELQEGRRNESGEIEWPN